MGNRALAFLVIVMMVLINVNTAGAVPEPEPWDWSRSFQALSLDPAAVKFLIEFAPQSEPPIYDNIEFVPTPTAPPAPQGMIQFGITLFDPQPAIPAALRFGFLGTGLSMGLPSVMNDEVQIQLIDSTENLMYVVSLGFGPWRLPPSPLIPVISSFDPQPLPPGILFPDDSEFVEFFLKLNTPSGAPFSGDALVTFSLYDANGSLVPMALVPEPATILLVGFGLAGVGLFRRRIKN